MGRVDFSFCVITDRHQTRGRSLLEICDAAFRAGVRAVQLREKDLPTRSLLFVARELGGAAASYGARMLLNDRVDLALAMDNRCVQLPAAGLPAGVARSLLGQDSLIGVSTHSVEEAVRAEAAGADFLVLGPIFETPSKRSFGPPIGLDELETARARCRLPIFAIGGVTKERVHEVRRAGAHGVAVIAAVMAAEDVERTCYEFLEALSGAVPTEVD